MKFLPVWIIFGLLLCAGCSGEAKEKKSGRDKKDAAPSARDEDTAQEVFDALPPEGAGAGGGPPAAKKDKAQQDADRKPTRGESQTRKIVYTAQLSLIVDDLSQAEEALLELVDKHKGLVAKATITGSSGTPRQGHWRFRIPVERLEDFRRAVVKLGVPETNTVDSEDVTGRYYDLEASIKTYKASEETLRKLMDKAVGKVDELLAVEKGLAARREKIEQLQGELNRLANLTALTTVHVTFREIKNYVPPQAPTFGNRLSSTFSDSVDALAGFGRGLVLLGAAVAPWLPLLAAVLVPSWVVVRRRLRQARRDRQGPLEVIPAQNP